MVESDGTQEQQNYQYEDDHGQSGDRGEKDSSERDASDDLSVRDGCEGHQVVPGHVQRGKVHAELLAQSLHDSKEWGCRLVSHFYEIAQ